MKECGELPMKCAGGRAGAPVHKRWLTVPEAAIELGVGEGTVRTWCNARPPKIEHKREGTRARGCRGTVLIDRAVIEAHNERQTCRPNATRPSIPERRRCAAVLPT